MTKTNNLTLILNDNMVDMAHQLLSQVVEPGDIAVDATCGRGRDTLVLATEVGPKGKVIAFDIQQEAIADTAELLAENQLADRVILHQADHGRMKEFVHTPIKAAIFNLGYLPGGDKNIKTLEKTTVKGMQEAITLLVAGGILIVVAYPGHHGGSKERDAVTSLLASLAGNGWRTGSMVLVNKREAPCLFYAVKIREERE